MSGLMIFAIDNSREKLFEIERNLILYCILFWKMMEKISFSFKTFI